MQATNSGCSLSLKTFVKISFSLSLAAVLHVKHTMNTAANMSPRGSSKMLMKLCADSLQSQHHDDEKRALSREIIVLNNHLMEAKLTIEKLQEDNVSLQNELNRVVK